MKAGIKQIEGGTTDLIRLRRPFCDYIFDVVMRGFFYYTKKEQYAKNTRLGDS